jgi:adenylyltransferase/sulfurtransferase
MSRYINLDAVPELGDKPALLRKKTVTVLGVGALGSRVAELLSRMGVHLRIIDKDRVYLYDMDKLSLFTEEHDAKFKAKEAKKLLEDINKEIKVKAFHEELMDNNAYLIEADVIIDCSNNRKTSLLADSARKKTPLIIARAGGVMGTVLIIDDTRVKQIEGFLEKTSPVLPEGTVLPTTVQFVAAVTVNKALQVLTGQKYEKSLLKMNTWKNTFEKIPVKKK